MSALTAIQSLQAAEGVRAQPRNSTRNNRINRDPQTEPAAVSYQGEALPMSATMSQGGRATFH